VRLDWLVFAPRDYVEAWALPLFTSAEAAR
jgi:hypothetical protein